jgi:hypothetical protein
MAIMNSRLGKCVNFGNCSIADARATVEVAKGSDFVCTGCGKPLLPIDSGEAVGGWKTRGVGVLIAVLAVVGAAAVGALIAALAVPEVAAWFQRLRPGAVASRVAVDPPPPVTVAVPQDKPKRPDVPVTGDCSEADQQAGICMRPR